MTPDQLRAIEERCSKATAGPWRLLAEDPNGVKSVTAEISQTGHDDDCSSLADCFNYTDEQDKANAEFIAHAREDLPALVQEVKRLMTELAEAKERAEYWENVADCLAKDLKKLPPAVAAALQLRADNARLREALGTCVKEMVGGSQCLCPAMPLHIICDHCDAIVKARAALATEKATASDPKTLPSPPDHSA